LDEAQRAWERDAERSSLFREAMLLLSIDEWESGGRSALFKVAKAIVEQEEWEDSSDRSALFDACWNLVEQEEWEANNERSELFKVAKAIVEQEEWEDSNERSALFDVCWNLVEQEEWEDSNERSALFDVCWNLVEHEEWEDSTERSALFDACLLSVYPMEEATLMFNDESQTSSNLAADDRLLLPPRWTRSDLRHKAAGVAPLTSIVLEASLPSLTAAPACPEAQRHAADKSQEECSGKTGKIWSPNNVASLFEAWSLPPSLDLGAS